MVAELVRRRSGNEQTPIFHEGHKGRVKRGLVPDRDCQKTLRGYGHDFIFWVGRRDFSISIGGERFGSSVVRAPMQRLLFAGAQRGGATAPLRLPWPSGERSSIEA